MTYVFFFFNDTATTEIYTLSLHDALPIYEPHPGGYAQACDLVAGIKRIADFEVSVSAYPDRKSTRLNSSHANISYAVFCLKKKKTRASTTYRSLLSLSSLDPLTTPATTCS